LYELYLHNIPVILIHRHQSLVFDFWLVTHELSLVPLSPKLTLGLWCLDRKVGSRPGDR
jgi:hypothetical protein